MRGAQDAQSAFNRRADSAQPLKAHAAAATCAFPLFVPLTTASQRHVFERFLCCTSSERSEFFMRPTCNISRRTITIKAWHRLAQSFEPFHHFLLQRHKRTQPTYRHQPTHSLPLFSICSLIVASMRFKSEAFCYPKKASDAVLRDGVTCVTDGQLSQAQRATRFAMPNCAAPPAMQVYDQV